MNRNVYVYLSYLWGASIYLAVTETTMFYKKDLCDVQARLANKCMQEVSRSESAVGCCVRCNWDDDCVGASLQVNTSSCSLHSQCSAVSGCIKPDQGFLYFKKAAKPLSCVNGTWNHYSESCECQPYFAGKLCQREPNNCTELAQKWPHVNKTVMITSIALNNKTVLCQNNKYNLTTAVARVQGDLNFNQTWASYVAGFSEKPFPRGLSFFTGLENIRLLMGPKPRTIRIRLELKDDSVVEDRYTGVVLGNISNNYTIRFEGHKRFMKVMTNGSCLELSNMTAFSTWDSDHDGNSKENWALKAGAGWWFPTLNSLCNPLGAFYGNTTILTAQDGYIRFPGVTLDDVANNLERVTFLMEEELCDRR